MSTNEKYQIFSDSSCDLNNLWISDTNVIPFYVSLDGKNYQKEKEELLVDLFYQNMIGIYPKTSTPTAQDYIEKFMPVIKKGEDIICLTISSEFSSSIQSANIAKDIILEEFPERKIHIEDSRQATIPQGLLMIQLLLMEKAGVDFDVAVQYLKKNKERAGVHFVVGDISYLQIGGRLGATIGSHTGARTFGIAYAKKYEKS